MKEFFDYIIKNLVDQPEAVDVQVVERETSTLVEVRVSPDDVAKVVGRKGRIINSLRTIALTVGARFGKRVRLELIDKEPEAKPAEIEAETASEEKAEKEPEAESTAQPEAESTVQPETEAAAKSDEELAD